MTAKKSYRQLNAELNEIIFQLEGNIDDLDKAIELHGQAAKIIVQLETYLQEVKIAVDKSTKNRNK